MIVRKANEKDIPEMLELLKQVNMVHHVGRPDIFNIGTKYTDEEIRGLLADDHYAIFAAVDEKDVMKGYAFCIIKQIVGDNIRTDIKTLYIDDLCVDENCRGEGIGGLLYKHCVAYAKEIGCYNLTLNVWELNEPAKKFYEKCGLKVQKQEMETIL